jgi:hypothetical protein
MKGNRAERGRYAWRRHVRWMLWGAVPLLFGSECNDCTLSQPGFRPPADAVLSPTDPDTWLSFRDNPLLDARVAFNGRLLFRDSTNYYYEYEQFYAPDAHRLTGNRSDLFKTGRSAYLWIDYTPTDSEWDTEIQYLANAGPTLHPSLNLPWREPPVELRLERVDGDTFRTSEVDRTRVALHPDVLLVPVDIYVFRAPGDPPAPYPIWNRQLAEQCLDPGPVQHLRTTFVSDENTSLIEVHSALLREVAGGNAPVDFAWSQCNIQFRLSVFEAIVQSDGLETSFVDDNSCRGGRPIQCREMSGENEPRFHKYLTTNRSNERPSEGGYDYLHRYPGVPVFLGGYIPHCAGAHTTYGVTCSGTSGCATTIGGSYPKFIAMNERYTFSEPFTLAHELGHFLGLGHTNGSTSSCAEDTESTDPNLMRVAGAHSLENAVLTPGQCDRARCIAKMWLGIWGLITADEAPRAYASNFHRTRALS